MWELDCEESWELKNWCFWTVVLEKTLESPLECKEIWPVHSKEISPGISLEGMMLKLKLQYFGCWEGLGAGGKGDDRGWDGWMASLTWWTWVWVNSRSWWWTGRPGMLRFMGSQRVKPDWATELNWTELRNSLLVSPSAVWLSLLLSQMESGTFQGPSIRVPSPLTPIYASVIPCLCFMLWHFPYLLYPFKTSLSWAPFPSESYEGFREWQK